MNRVREWRIHIGAHKTATTHIQYVLEGMREMLSSHGLDLMVPHRHLREKRLNTLEGEHFRRRSILRRDCAELFRDTVEDLRCGHERVLLSEENLLGTLAPIIRGTGYEQHTFICKLLGQLSEQSKVTLFLSIRSPVTYLPSAYSQNLRFQAPPAGGFDSVKRNWCGSRPFSWAKLVRVLRRFAPSVGLVIWRYEDYRAHQGKILSVLCQLPMPSTLDHLPAPQRTISGSASAVALAELLDRKISGEERFTRVSEIYADPALAGSSFQPFSRSEIESINNDYAKDIREIDKLAPNALMKF